MTAVTPRAILLMLVGLLLIMTLGMVYTLSVETHTALKDAMQNKLIAVASTTASQIDGDTFNRIQPGDEKTEAFIRIRDQLKSVKTVSPDIRYIYTMRKEGDAIVFVIDADYGTDPESPTIGTFYPEAEPEMFAGFAAPTADREFTTDEWGTVLSGFSPIRDRAGNVVGIVGVDMDSTVVSKELDYLNRFFYGIGIVALVTVVFGIIILERRRAIDAQKIEENERKYRLLFERAGDAIFLLDTEGDRLGAILSANNAAAQMHGYTPEELRRMNLSDLDTTEAKKELSVRFATILSGIWLNGEVTHLKKDGSELPVEFSSGVLDLGQKRVIFAIYRDITERRKADDALHQVTRKLNLLNAVTLNDIQNAVFTLNGYITLSKTYSDIGKIEQAITRIEESVGKISHALNFLKSYQDLGVKPARWHDVNQTFILGISHLDFSMIRRDIQVKNLEIFADSLLERVFFAFADNVLHHAPGATEVRLGYQTDGDSLILFFADNGPGIPPDQKQLLFERGYGLKKGMELFLVREILGITGITIRENGVPGSGARFEMTVPRGGYRFRKEN